MDAFEETLGPFLNAIEHGINPLECLNIETQCQSKQILSFYKECSETFCLDEGIGEIFNPCYKISLQQITRKKSTYNEILHMKFKLATLMDCLDEKGATIDDTENKINENTTLFLYDFFLQLNKMIDGLLFVCVLIKVVEQKKTKEKIKKHLYNYCEEVFNKTTRKVAELMDMVDEPIINKINVSYFEKFD